MNTDDNNDNTPARKQDLFDAYAELGRNNRTQQNGVLRPYSADDVVIALELLRRNLPTEAVRALTGVSSYTLRHWMTLAQIGMLERSYPNIRERAALLDHDMITKVIGEYARRTGDPEMARGSGSVIKDRWESWNPSGTQH